MSKKHTGTGIAGEITAQMKKLWVVDAIGLGTVAVLAIVSEDIRHIIADMAETTLGVLIIVFFAAMAIKDIWFLVKWNAIRSSVEQCWVKVENDKVVGYTAENLENPQNTHYFEIQIEDIRDIDLLPIDIPRRQCYTLGINHKYGTVKIPVDENGNVKRCIEEAVQKW